MGLIAREIESRGIPSLSMSSAYSITRAVRPPRAVHLDFPLGHTAGKALEDELNLEIMRSTLAAFESLDEPGRILRLPFEWTSDDAWKDDVMRPKASSRESAGEGAAARHEDDRVERVETPQYQTDADREAAEAAMAEGGCATCVFLDEPAPDAG